MAKTSNEIVQQDMLLQGWDPDEPVPATILRPAADGKLPVVIVLHGIGCSRQSSMPIMKSLAEAGFLAIGIDGFLHGQRREPSLFAPGVADLKESLAVWVHQTCASYTARDVSRIIDGLGSLDGADPARVGVVGVSMGGCSAMVLAQREKRLSAVVSIIGAADFWWDVTKLAPGPEQQARRATYSPRLTQLVNSLDPMGHHDHVYPKPVLMLSGAKDHWIDPRSVEKLAELLRTHYPDCPEKVSCVVEPDVGHQVTDLMIRRATEWFVRYCR